jgi:uncharacterized protein (DUF1330 family)
MNTRLEQLITPCAFPCHGLRCTDPTDRKDAMPAYAIAHLQEATPHPEIAEYIERITATFEPHGGRFLAHATQHEVKEGTWPGHVVMIGFPGIAEARA